MKKLPRLRQFYIVPAMMLSVGVFASQSSFECMLEPEMIAELGNSSPGVLDAVAVKRGDSVTAGQVVATMVSGVERAAVEVARARVDGTAEIESAEIRKAFGERKYQRTIELTQKKFASEFDLDEARTDMVLAEKSLLEAQDAMVLSRAELKRAEEYLALKTVTSPFDGVVVERYHNPGERVDDEPIVKLAKVDPLYAEALLPVGMLGKISEGDIGVITTEYDSNSRYEAPVVVVDRVVDAASGFFRVRLELPNPDGVIPAGLECVVDFTKAEIGGLSPAASADLGDD